MQRVYTIDNSSYLATDEGQSAVSRFAIYAWGVLAYNLLVVLWGAYVRATGSGAGCGSHWPLCNGEVLPRAGQIETLIELSHRLTSGLALVLVVGMIAWARRAYPAKHPVRRAAGCALLLMLTETLVGAGLVLFELTANNASTTRALVLSIHLVNTFLLLAALALTAWWATSEERVQFGGGGTHAWMLGIGLVGTLLLGVSGAVTALGDTLFPVSSLAEGWQQDFSPAAHLFIRLRLLHPVIAICIGLHVVFTATLASFQYAHARVKQLAAALVILVVLQFIIGTLNVALLAPVLVQLIHLLLADLLWLTLVLLTATMLTQQPAGRLAND